MSTTTCLLAAIFSTMKLWAACCLPSWQLSATHCNVTLPSGNNTTSIELAGLLADVHDSLPHIPCPPDCTTHHALRLQCHEVPDKALLSSGLA